MQNYFLHSNLFIHHCCNTFIRFGSFFAHRIYLQGSQASESIDYASYSLGLMLGFISVILIILSIRNMLMVCFHHVMGDTVDRNLLSWFAILYFIQIYLAWLMLFMRLHIEHVRFNQCIITSFKVMFGLSPFITALYVTYLIWLQISGFHKEDALFSSHIVLNVSMFSILMLCSVIMPVVLVVLFVWKLMQMYKQIHTFRDMKERDRVDILIPVITRHTVLGVVYVTLTLLTMASCFVHVVLSTYLGLINIYCNFVCIMLAYVHLNEYYFKTCGVLDKRCGILCRYVVNKHILNDQDEEGITQVTQRDIQQEEKEQFIVLSTDGYETTTYTREISTTDTASEGQHETRRNMNQGFIKVDGTIVTDDDRYEDDTDDVSISSSNLFN
eukprot:1060333_1